MHKKSNLLSLEQRRTFQLLNLMYLHKHDVNILGILVQQTHGADPAQFIVEKYMHDIVSSDTVHQFKTLLRSRYNEYVDTTA